MNYHKKNHKMKPFNEIVGIITILTLMLSACKRGEYVEYRNSSAQEKEIIEKSREIFPEVIVQQLENELLNLSQQENQQAYLDSINIALGISVNYYSMMQETANKDNLVLAAKETGSENWQPYHYADDFFHERKGFAVSLDLKFFF
jgi:hypothetical protein